MPVVKLMSRNAEIFTVDWEVARVSLYIRRYLDDLEWVGDEADVIPLPNVYSSVLKKVIEWAEQHRDDGDEGEWDDLEDLDEWHKEFIDVTPDVKFELMLAANYLDLKGLLNFSVKALTKMIKGLTVEEIRENFGIKNDYTPEEEEMVRKENEWCEER